MGDIADYLVAEEPPFRAVAEALALGVPFRVELASDGRSSRFLHMGAGCLALTGLPAEAFLADSHTLTAIMPSDEVARLVADKSAALAERRPCRGEFRLRRPSGELRWIRLAAAPQLRSDGSSVWEGLMTDVTDARRLTDQLAFERRRLELAVEVSGIGVYEWDRDDPDSLVWSERQCEIYGLEPCTAMTPDRFWSLVHPDDRETAMDQSLAPLRGGDNTDYSMEHRIVRPSGEIRWVQLRARSFWDREGLRRIYGTTLDVTERREAEERRRLQMRELAHRGKNALSVMMAMVQQAGRKARTADEMSDVLMARLEAMARSQDLVTAWEGARLPLSELLNQVLEPFDLARFDIDPSLSGVSFNGEASIGLGLLLHELATNAVKYGALSNTSGRIGLSREAEGGCNVLCWRESGGPPVQPPQRQGFGSRLMSAVLQGRGGRGVQLRAGGPCGARQPAELTAKLSAPLKPAGQRPVAGQRRCAPRHSGRS